MGIKGNSKPGATGSERDVRPGAWLMDERNETLRHFATLTLRSFAGASMPSREELVSTGQQKIIGRPFRIQRLRSGGLLAHNTASSSLL